MNIQYLFSYLEQTDLDMSSIVVRELTYRLPRKIRMKRRYPNGAVFALCPRCNTPLSRDYLPYCDQCGQQLTWCSYGRNTPIEARPPQAVQQSLFD